MAEISVPHETEDALFSMVGMFPQVDADVPFIAGAMILQAIVEDTLANYRQNFIEVASA